MNLKPVCFLLSLCYAAPAPALGLGELSLRSYLGQPLHATVRILDAGTTAAVDCFSIAPRETSTAPPLRAQLALEQADSQTLLHIRTPQSVNDPITQFVHMKRECKTVVGEPEPLWRVGAHWPLA